MNLETIKTQTTWADATTCINNNNAKISEAITRLETSEGDGEDSEGDKTFYYEQGIASREWVVNHNLGKKPSVMVFNSANDEVIGDIEYNNLNTVTLSFSAEFAGFAIFN